MAARAAREGRAIRVIEPGLEARQSRWAAHVDDLDIHSRAQQTVQQAPAEPAGHCVEHNRAVRLEPGPIVAVAGVPLNHLAETVDQSLGRRVAATETVGGGAKYRDVHARPYTEVELAQLSRHPGRAARRQIGRRKPVENEPV